MLRTWFLQIWEIRSSEEQAVAELDRRWKASQAENATVPHEAVVEWLNSWGTPEFQTPPPAMKLEWSELALADLDRFAEFLHEKFPHLASQVATAIIKESRVLLDHPRLGRSIGGHDEYRQLSLRVLNGVYVFQYRIEGERIVMLRVFHGRESRRP